MVCVWSCICDLLDLLDLLVRSPLHSMMVLMRDMAPFQVVQTSFSLMYQQDLETFHFDVRFIVICQGHDRPPSNYVFSMFAERVSQTVLRIRFLF